MDLGSTLIQYDLNLITSAEILFQITSHSEFLGGHEFGGGALFNPVQGGIF